METKNFMNGNQAIEIIKSLSKSQGFYGRLLRYIEEFTKEQLEDFNRIIENAKLTDSVDLVLFLES